MSTFGWRWWDIAPNGSLQSVNHVLWPPNEALRAECGVRPPEIDKFHNQVGFPHLDCSCGYWAFHDPELAEGLPHSSGYFKRCKVFGIVEAWGGICWHEWGFRAEWVIPRAIVVKRGRLHAAYEIPRYKSVDDICKVWDVPTSGEVL